MNRISLTGLAALALALLAGAWLVDNRSAQGDSYGYVPAVVSFTGTVPSTSSLPATQFSCFARPYGPFGGQLYFSAFCYTGNQPFDLVEDGTTPFTFFDQRGRALLVGPWSPGNDLVIPIVDCLALEPRLDIRFVLDLNTGGTSEIQVREDPDPAGDCSGSPDDTAPLIYIPRSQADDFDGDGCPDYYELGAADFAVPTATPGPRSVYYGLRDPFNDADCVEGTEYTDYFNQSGVYLVWAELDPALAIGGDVGVFYRCIVSIEQSGNSNITARPYCYIDDPNVVVNPEDSPGATGDGLPGGRPPDTKADVWGDVDGEHDTLYGSFDSETHEITLSGCIEDRDNASSVGDIFLEWRIDTRFGFGTTDVWYDYAPQNACGPSEDPGAQAPTFAGGALNIEAGKVGDEAAGVVDFDDDGVPDSRELQDDPGCGRRDPFNKNDYYDVSVPRDGVIDLANDILGTIVHFAPGGYPAGDENWDRPPAMIGAGGNWNRGSPDGVIDLANDILGVILQFNPGGCPALQ